MAFSGKDLFEFVTKLNEKKGDFQHSQGAYRAIISRSYYSAFLEARHHLGIQEGERCDVHRTVCTRLKARNTSLGNKLSTLLKNRKHADYVMSRQCAPRDVSESIRLASDIISNLNSESVSE